MSRPVLLDMCSRQGGTSMGYERAGFRVVCNDLDPQPRNPFEFVQGDAFAIFEDMVRTYRPAAVAWSPMCEGYSATWRINKVPYPQMIGPARELSQATGLPYVIENVPDAAWDMKEPIELCGTMFGLHTYRHRLFESNVPLSVPEHPVHARHTVKMGRPLAEGDFYHAVGNFSNVPYVRRDMGVPWMTREGIRECVPPAYTQYIGEQLMKGIKG